MKPVKIPRATETLLDAICIGSNRRTLPTPILVAIDKSFDDSTNTPGNTRRLAAYLRRHADALDRAADKAQRGGA